MKELLPNSCRGLIKACGGGVSVCKANAKKAHLVTNPKLSS